MEFETKAFCKNCIIVQIMQKAFLNYIIKDSSFKDYQKSTRSTLCHSEAEPKNLMF